MIKYMFAFDEDNNLRLCKNLGIFYQENVKITYDDIESTLELFTLCFCIKTKEFWKIKCVDLPKRLHNRYQNVRASDDLKKELESIGIHNYKDISPLVDNYVEYLDQLEIKKYRLKNSNENQSYYQKLLRIQKDLLNSKDNIKKLEKK